VYFIDEKGKTSPAYNFPTGKTGSVTLSLPIGNHQLKFSVPAGYESFPLEYNLSPQGGRWANPNALSDYRYQFNQGTDYTITASNIL
jgi:hypothetical protein